LLLSVDDYTGTPVGGGGLEHIAVLVDGDPVELLVEADGYVIVSVTMSLGQAELPGELPCVTMSGCLENGGRPTDTFVQ